MGKKKSHPLLTCRQVVTYINDPETESSFRKRIAVRVHLLMCEHCSAYLKQLRYLKRGLKNLIERKSTVSEERVAKVEHQVLTKLRAKRSADSE